MVTVENWQTNHDKVCAQRWGILIKLIGWGGGMAIAALLSLGGWALQQVHQDQAQQLQLLQQLIAHR